MVVDYLYAIFNPWKIKCENKLEADLASMPDTRKCNIILIWLGDQGLEMYQAWCLEPSEISIEKIVVKIGRLLQATS